MFFHHLKYSLKILFKSKSLIFWTFAFPIILGTLFYMAFSNIENSEKLQIIDIAIIKTEEWQNNSIWQETFKELGDASKDTQIFKIFYTDLEEAQKLMKEQEIIGYLTLQNGPQITVLESGINETILKSVTEKITALEEIIQNRITTELSQKELFEREQINSTIAKIIEEVTTYQEQSYIKDTSQNNLSYTMIEYYTLIAMACLYGGILSMYILNQNLPNMSSNGKRIALSPIPKKTIISSSVLASYLTSLLGLTILFIYTIFILHVDYGPRIYQIILLALLGSFAGVAIGIFISSILKVNEKTKTGIIISYTMFSCFLSGMMGITMKYIIDTNIPLLNILNPANMITDGFYSLYYYEQLKRYYFNIISLLIFSIILIVCSILALRRQTYDSI